MNEKKKGGKWCDPRTILLVAGILGLNERSVLGRLDKANRSEVEKAKHKKNKLKEKAKRRESYLKRRADNARQDASVALNTLKEILNDG